MEKKIILITGAAGFIGSSIARDLLDSEETELVIGIDNVNSYYSYKIKERRIKELSINKKFKFHNISILNIEEIRSLATKYQPEVLIHTAAEVGVRNGENNVSDYITTNILGTRMLLEQMNSALKHVIVFSSSSVYGNIKKVPYSETEPITLSTPLSVYGSTKAGMEIMVHNFYYKTKIPTTIVRPFSVYGPDGRPDMLPMKMLLAAKNGKAIELFAPSKNYRDWTYIQDVVLAIKEILIKPMKFQIVNIGSGNPIRLDETTKIAQAVIKEYGYVLRLNKRPQNKNEVLITHSDTEKLFSQYGVSMKTSFEKGFRKTAEFFFSHEDLYL